VSLTKEQRHVMRSALGLNMRDCEYRNHFAASSVDAKIWDGLCKLGFAELYGQGGGTLHLKYYHVTDAGRRALAEEKEG